MYIWICAGIALLLLLHGLSNKNVPVKGFELLEVLSYDTWRSTTDIQNRFEKKFGVRLTIDQIFSEMKLLIESGLVDRRETNHRAEFRKIKKGKPDKNSPIDACPQPA